MYFKKLPSYSLRMKKTNVAWPIFGARCSRAERLDLTLIIITQCSFPLICFAFFSVTLYISIVSSKQN